MSVSAAYRIGFVVSSVRRIAKEVKVVGNGCDIAIGVRIEVLARLTLITSALNDVIQMRNHAGRNERLPVIVEIDTPRVAGPVRENVKLVPRRMIPPDRGVKRNAFLVRRPRFADARVSEHAVAPV